MKRFALPIGALAFALACTDATSPDPHASLTPRAPALGQDIGNLPPPPVDAAIEITVSSTPVFGLFTGTYFANGAAAASVTAALAANDQELAFNGTAWLRLDNVQGFGSTASANARFQVIHALTDEEKRSGHGTLVIQGETIRIVEVTSFTSNPTCSNLTFIPCAVITFTATIDSDPTGELHHGTAEAFNREVCEFFPGGEGPPYFICPDDEVIG
jgi:hypothetical protein